MSADQAGRQRISHQVLLGGQSNVDNAASPSLLTLLVWILWNSVCQTVELRYSYGATVRVAPFCSVLYCMRSNQIVLRVYPLYSYDVTIVLRVILTVRVRVQTEEVPYSTLYKTGHPGTVLVPGTILVALQVSELYQSIGTQTRAPVGPKSIASQPQGKSGVALGKGICLAATCRPSKRQAWPS